MRWLREILNRLWRLMGHLKKTKRMLIKMIVAWVSRLIPLLVKE